MGSIEEREREGAQARAACYAHAVLCTVVCVGPVDRNTALYAAPLLSTQLLILPVLRAPADKLITKGSSSFVIR